MAYIKSYIRLPPKCMTLNDSWSRFKVIDSLNAAKMAKYGLVMSPTPCWVLCLWLALSYCMDLEISPRSSQSYHLKAVVWFLIGNLNFCGRIVYNFRDIGRGNDNIGWNDLQMSFKVIECGTNPIKRSYMNCYKWYSNFRRVTHRFRISSHSRSSNVVPIQSKDRIWIAISGTATFAVSLTVSEISLQDVLMLKTTFLPTPLVFVLEFEGHAVRMWRRNLATENLEVELCDCHTVKKSWLQVEQCGHSPRVTSVTDRQTDGFTMTN